MHQPAGIATNWAMCAEIGETIEILGPGYLKIEPHIGDWYLFAADMTALPAAISVIESLSSDAKGFAFLEVTQEVDKQKINLPENLEVTWLYHAKPKTKSGQQLKAIKELKIPEGQPNVFVAGELSTIREIKQFLIQNEKFSNAITYISSYWKTGLNEEGYKKEKQKSEIK